MKHASTGSKWSQSNKRVKFKDDNMLKEINAQIQEKNKRIRRVEFEDEEEEDKDEEIVEEKPKETKPAVSLQDKTEVGMLHEQVKSFLDRCFERYRNKRMVDRCR